MATPTPPGLRREEETVCVKCRFYICDCVCPETTGYSRKRRLLREHRKTLRAYEDAIADEPVMQRRFLHHLADYGAQDWCLCEHPLLDESSDTEDPEAALREQCNSTDAFVRAARDALEAEALRRAFEQKCMELEDLRSRHM